MSTSSSPISQRNTDPLLNERQAAKYLNLSVRTMQAWRLRGGGPAFVKIGRAVRYRASDLTAFIDAGMRASTSDPGPALMQ